MLSFTRYTIRAEALVPWVKFIWSLEDGDANVDYKLLPTDCIDLILCLSGKIIYETDSNRITAPPLHMNGLHDRHCHILQTGAVHVFGISFYSFGLFPFVNKSLEHIQNRIVDSHDLSIQLAQKLEAAVSDITGDTTALIEKALCSGLRTTYDCRRKSNLIRDYLETTISAGAFCGERGVNTKHLKE